jgi:hypothetical protein
LVAKAKNDFCYVWSECEKDSILTPIQTYIKSIDEIFAKNDKLKITHKPIHLPSTTFSMPSARNILIENISKNFNNEKYSDLKIKI